MATSNPLSALEVTLLKTFPTCCVVLRTDSTREFSINGNIVQVMYVLGLDVKVRENREYFKGGRRMVQQAATYIKSMV